MSIRTQDCLVSIEWKSEWVLHSCLLLFFTQAFLSTVFGSQEKKFTPQASPHDGWKSLLPSCCSSSIPGSSIIQKTEAAAIGPGSSAKAEHGYSAKQSGAVQKCQSSSGLGSSARAEQGYLPKAKVHIVVGSRCCCHPCCFSVQAHLAKSFVTSTLARPAEAACGARRLAATAF